MDRHRAETQSRDAERCNRSLYCRRGSPRATIGNNGVPTNRLTGKREEIVYEPMIGRDESVHVPRSMSFAVKVKGHPEDWASAMRSEVAALDPNLPIAEVRTLEALVADARAPTAFAMVLLGIAAVVALVLGAIGVYGVQSYMVSQRTGEIGVRMALGATAGHVRRMILRRGATVAVAGVVIGWVGALGMTQWIESLLIGVPPRDIGTYAAVSVVLVNVAMTVIGVSPSWTALFGLFDARASVARCFSSRMWAWTRRSH